MMKRSVCLVSLSLLISLLLSACAGSTVPPSAATPRSVPPQAPLPALPQEPAVAPPVIPAPIPPLVVLPPTQPANVSAHLTMLPVIVGNSSPGNTSSSAVWVHPFTITNDSAPSIHVDYKVKIIDSRGVTISIYQGEQVRDLWAGETFWGFVETSEASHQVTITLSQPAETRRVRELSNFVFSERTPLPASPSTFTFVVTNNSTVSASLPYIEAKAYDIEGRYLGLARRDLIRDLDSFEPFESRLYKSPGLQPLYQLLYLLSGEVHFVLRALDTRP